MKVLATYNQYFGRMGSLDGLFICEEENLARAMGRKVYFGEVLGKHSEVTGSISDKTVKVISTEQDKIGWLTQIFSTNQPTGFEFDGVLSGINPINNIRCGKCQEDMTYCDCKDGFHWEEYEEEE